MIFADRTHAGQILAQKLKVLKIGNASVAAIPRGGVVVASEIARVYKLPIFPLVIKKLGAPANPELAIGATASFGKPVLDRWLIADLGVSSDYLKAETLKKRKEARAREKSLGVELANIDFIGKTVIVVDDGMATGQTAKLASKILRQFGVGRLILAVGCAPTSAVEMIKADYESVICPEIRDDFMAVGQCYRDFRPIDDEEVKRILNIKN